MGHRMTRQQQQSDVTEPLFLINNVYSFRNRGDSAIVEATARYIQSIRASAQIALLSLYWKDNLNYYNHFGWQSAPLLWDVPLHANKLRRLIVGAGALCGLLIPALSRNPTSRLYEQARAILDVGGGMLFSSRRYLLQLGFYQHLLTLLAGRAYNKPVVICPQSIGPFNNPIDRMSVRYVLRRMTAVLAREGVSSALLDKMGVRHTIAPDIALLGNFITQPGAAAQRLRDEIVRDAEGRKRIGLTVLDWRWAANSAHRDEPIAAYMERLCVALRTLANKHNLYVRVFAQVAPGVDDNDAGVSREVSGMLRARLADTLSIVAYAPDDEANLNPSDLCHVYGGMDLFIASRMHSAIFALLQAVPAIGLSYQPKTRGTYNLLGLEDWTMDTASFAPNDLAERCALLLDHATTTRLRIEKATARAHAQLTQVLETELRPLVLPSGL